MLKILKATETIFRSRVVGQNMGINTEKNLDLKIECAVFAQLGPDIFNNVPGHFFEHRLEIESDHLSSLLRIVARKYINLRLKTYDRKFTEMMVHQNQPSTRHQLTKNNTFLKPVNKFPHYLIGSCKWYMYII